MVGDSDVFRPKCRVEAYLSFQKYLGVGTGAAGEYTPDTLLALLVPFTIIASNALIHEHVTFSPVQH